MSSEWSSFIVIAFNVTGETMDGNFMVQGNNQYVRRDTNFQLNSFGAEKRLISMATGGLTGQRMAQSIDTIDGCSVGGIRLFVGGLWAKRQASKCQISIKKLTAQGKWPYLWPQKDSPGK
jgi:hypothetical protein